MKEPKPPIYRNGELICPHRKTPLLAEEGMDRRFCCTFCKKEVGRLADETMKRMVDDFPRRPAEGMEDRNYSSH